MKDKVFISIQNNEMIDATSGKGRDVAAKQVFVSRENNGMIDATSGKGRDVAAK